MPPSTTIASTSADSPNVKDSGLSALPATLDDYLARVVAPTLERQKKDGAVAIKFEAAYLRSLNFGEPNRAEAEQAYAHYAEGGTPPKSDYLALQDVLFREIARAAGRMGLAVHIHTGAGCGGYFDIAGSNPELLDSVLDDPTLRQTKFVLLHGGSPKGVELMAAKWATGRKVPQIAFKPDWTKHAKAAPKQYFRQVLCPHSAEIASHQEASGNPGSRRQISVAGLVILPECQGSDRRQQGS